MEIGEMGDGECRFVIMKFSNDLPIDLLIKND